MGYGEESKVLTKLERARSAGTLPTASSLYSFTDPPNPTHNRAPCFSVAKRMNHSASGSFFGTFYQQAEERGYSFPGAGSYELDKSTVSKPATSCTKPSTLSRRPKISCASMGAARMTASLCGADQLLLEPGPEFGPAPRSEFDDAAGGRGYCTAAFSSQSKRFTAPHQIHGGYERRKFERKLPRKVVPAIRYPRLRTAPSGSWASGGGGVSRSGLTTAGGDAYTMAGQTSPISMGALVTTPGTSGGWVPQRSSSAGMLTTAPEGFIGPDPHTYRDELRTATKGRTRRLVAEKIRTDLIDVSALEDFKPPNTKALRFY